MQNRIVFLMLILMPCFILKINLGVYSYLIVICVYLVILFSLQIFQDDCWCLISSFYESHLAHKFAKSITITVFTHLFNSVFKPIWSVIISDYSPCQTHSSDMTNIFEWTAWMSSSRTIKKQSSRTFTWVSDLNSCSIELDTGCTIITLVYKIMYHMASIELGLKPKWPWKYIQVTTKKLLQENNSNK